MPLESLPVLRERAREQGPKRVAIVAAEDESALAALSDAVSAGVAVALLLGDEARIRELIAGLEGEAALLASARFVHATSPDEAARAAVALAREGEVDVLLKGHLRTDQLLRAVLDRDRGLRRERLLSDVLLYEDTLSGRRRLVGLTDGGVNVRPSLGEKTEIIRNAVEVFHRLGFERPRIALMSATEAVTEAIPSTVEARTLTQMGARGELGDCEVYGPLALDNALMGWAAQAKGLTHPVAGRADVMVVPNIEAGNLLGKAVKYFGGSACAHVIVGTRVPVLIPSRVESAEDKLNSIALGVIACEPS